MSQLNANEIAVLAMCYAGHPMPTDGAGEPFKWVQNAKAKLVYLGMLKEDDEYVAERGEVFMDYLTDLELPKKTWSMG
jgi:hypothetical protein